MTISDLIRLMENRLSYLNSLRANAQSAGDAVQVGDLDASIETTQNTLNLLRSLV
jgi:hypothetical protein